MALTKPGSIVTIAIPRVVNSHPALCDELMEMRAFRSTSFLPCLSSVGDVPREADVEFDLRA